VAVLSTARMGELTETTRTRLPLTLWIASAVFIVYGTTIPFNFVHDWHLVADHLTRLTWNPFIAADTGKRVSIPDFVSNVLLFIPFGFFGMWALPRPRSLGARIAFVAALGLALTISVESLQLLTIDRTTSVSDVIANTSGALGGAIAAVLLSTFVEGFLRTVSAAGIAAVPSFFPLLVATLVLLGGKFEPFDVTLDLGSVLSKLHSFLADPIQFGVPTDEVLSILQHLLFTSTLVVWLEETRIGPARAIAALVGVMVAVGTEATQLFIGSRMPGLWDAGIGITGALAGIPLGLSFVKSKKNPRWWAGVFVLTMVGVAMQQLSPFKLGEDVRPFQWIPFLNYYTVTSSETVSHSAELLLSYFPLGFGFALATRQRRRRSQVVLAAALLIAAPVEFLQRYIPGRFPDVTDVGLSLAGAWFGAWTATRGRRLFDDQMALVSPAGDVPAPIPAAR
jgi:glycopeptide antibiotics resistance protein